MLPRKSNSTAAWGVSQSFKVMCTLRRPLSWQNQNWTAMQQHRRANVVFLNDWLHARRASSPFSTTDDMICELFHPQRTIWPSNFSWDSRPFKVVIFPSIGQSQNRHLGSRTCCQECFYSWQAAVSWQSGGDSGQAHLLQVKTLSRSNWKLYNSQCCLAHLC